MRAIDTNVVVRYLTGDEPGHPARAKVVIDAGHVFVSTAALRAFSGLPGVSVESPALLAEALDCAEKCMDFADALHLGAAARCGALLTFDRRFIETAKGTSVRVMEPRGLL